MKQLRAEGVATDHLPEMDLTLEAGERLCLSGPSGVGKSLLLRALADLDPHRGKIWLDDREQVEIPAVAWRKQVGLLPAESAWWAETVGEHFSEPPAEGLRQLGFDESTLGWSVERLSSGEKQRLALLRLLANMPSVLLLDEPTANLDRESTAKAEALIKDYSQRHQAAVLWVSHDPEQIRRVATRHVRLQAGKLGEVALS
ncbi:ABC transporter ATP-binding protein [Sulfuriflexus mobilis]|uniref:ABC transporter ATP-binding protein n=1 Tax=Sulfuriflexus mobilis TaxID=1811807 RepID=UPI000F81C68A|nr:ATP-binding cassette domain-containing protein [Sulfuriflexus mobilis]